MIPERYLAPALTAIALFFATSFANDREYDPSSFTWNPALSPAGPVVVSVNLKTQTAAVYRNGIEIGTCLVATGREGFETPTGVFHILEKDADHHSSTYNNASMPYTERLTWGGVALHAGNIPGYPSSHGCVHLPFEFAKRLFSITEMGGTVIITEDAPRGGVSDGHRIEFVEHDSSDFDWKPHDSPAGPVSVLLSTADRELLIVRNGVVIGKGEAHLGVFAKKPHGTYAYVFDGWKRDAKSNEPYPHWHQVGGPADSHELKAFNHIKTDPRLKHVLDTTLTPGTNIVITDESLAEATRSHPGFHIMSGSLAAN
ncbi:L,D-transpeptidase family protein [Verrucomicrobiales bacterium BCK34]|nr:L,D-transpeptidase family protein [Verrucomicrobiales bacterium BCK34]